MPTLKDKYYDCLSRYGYMPILHILKEKELEEDYETCAVIEQVLIEDEIRFNRSLPREINPVTISEYKEGFWEFGYSGDIAWNNMMGYINEIKVYCK